MKTMRIILLLLLPFLSLYSCGHNDNPTPKPTTYLRIDMPAHHYQPNDSLALPFQFEYANEAQLSLKKNTPTEKWVDIRYPKYRGIIYLTYKDLASIDDLKGQIDTSYRLLSMHFDYSSGVEEQQYIDPVNKVYATTYHLQGQNVASTYQFWATDSTHHFLRGSLFLNNTPNNDSLAHVIEYLQEDVNHLLESLRWN